MNDQLAARALFLPPWPLACLAEPARAKPLALAAFDAHGKGSHVHAEDAESSLSALPSATPRMEALGGIAARKPSRPGPKSHKAMQAAVIAPTTGTLMALPRVQCACD